MTRRIVVALAALLAATGAAGANSAHAANIVVERPETPTSPAVVSLTARIGDGDYAAFIAATQDMKKATVYFFSEGGKITDGLLIGQTIREKRFSTAIADRNTCLSACALAWLGGVKRYLGTFAAVGFHAPYDKTGQRTAQSEAAVSR